MSYSKILSIGLFVCLLLLLGVFITTGGSPLVNEVTLGLAFILIAELHGALLMITHRSAPLILLFVTLVLLFFYAPMFGYLLYPDGFLPSYSVEDVNRALFYLILGSGAAILGIKLGSQLFTSIQGSTGKASSRPFYCSPRVFFATAVANVGIGIWIALTFGTASTIISKSNGGGFAFLIRLVDMTVVLMISLVLLIDNWTRASKSSRTILLLSPSIISLVNTFLGSRAALFNLLLFVLMLLTIKKGNFRVGRRMTILVVLAIPVSLLVFGVATGVRNYWNKATTLGFYPGLEEFAQSATSGGLGSTDPFKNLAYRILFRLNGLDPLVMVTSRNREEAGLSINIVNEFKSFVNIIMPGDPFPGIRETSKMFLVVYRDYPIEYLDSLYNTSMYTLWGICYALFGSIGGLLAIGILMFFVAWVYQWLSRLKTRFKTYWQLWWLYFVYNLILSFGFDRTLAYPVYWMIPGVLLLAILALLSPSRRIDLPDGSLKRRLVGSFAHNGR